ncbi:BTB domain and ankyrin repeat protein [Paracoccidioides lutzii Pb01]|uniref:BTB domain and ankyrin repeat protein n=1 Tax=Paracoccidioides lutzii (strain ATCC MYA-826 / Pb01) TaxID=502779 RepID=C1GRW1_PARBA|nr:BTB domain and ankyrin repeat protein [Paracoccidioides lutzii Pb01]EEH38335.2 BTB domain and ankyrin repeat protein [Paracoccidioides lutzii Pb01]
MSSKLWQYFLQDDVESFKRFLAEASSSRTHWKSTTPTSSAFTSTGTATLGVSPGSFLKNRPPTSSSPKQLPDKHPSSSTRNAPIALTRADVNTKDQYGRSLLHLIASSQKEHAIDFATALLEVPSVDIYAQDLESGWTALHRALYAGNVTIAHALIVRDIRDATGFRMPGGVHHPSGGLIKIKDREGNSPFDVFGATILPRDIVNRSSEHEYTSDEKYSVSTDSSVASESDHDIGGGRARPAVNLCGDEVFTFGSNKNLNLGLGDEGDRQFPERIALTRPDHLLYTFHREYETIRAARTGSDPSAVHPDINSVTEIPTLVRARPISFRQIVMSKLHTGILTNDPVSNLFICGFGPGGRLGTGDENTRFSFVCIEGGGLAGKKVVALALGQDHSIAISEQGEVFSWGSNKNGQLGYTLPQTNKKNDVPIQTIPRQIFNPFKKEAIIGAAASSIHSVVFTPTSLYTFGKNEGQLGLIDADARSLESQTIPRRVGASLFSSPIVMVSAIDRATSCLLENHEVWVFTHYGYSKIVFPLDGTSSFIRDSFMSTRYGSSTNYISKITSGGNTICAMSSFGEVYTVNVSRKPDISSTASSTTNPAKIRNSLPQPSRVWSIKKVHMAVRDVDVGQDGSIIICTESGFAWRKEKLAKIKDADSKISGETRLKDYKFVRVPGLSRVVAVRSNAYGAFAAVQRGCNVAREQICVDTCMLWRDLKPLSPFDGILKQGDSDSRTSMSMDVMIGDKYIKPCNLESAIKSTLDNAALSNHFLNSIVWVSTTSSDVRIPVHEFILAARSSVLRRAFSEFRKTYYYSILDVFGIEYDKNGHITIKFNDVDFLSIFILALYLYTEEIYDVWTLARQSPSQAADYKRVRIEVLKISTVLELQALERASRLMTLPHKRLNLDMERAFKDPNFFENSDVIIELDGGDMKAHSQILCKRCPFFDGLFYGRASGRWLAGRRAGSPDSIDPLRIDLKHISHDIFKFVMRYIYADTDDELFEHVKLNDLADLIDLVIDVMAVANELMLDRLAQICQKLLGRFVNNRNACHYLNAVAPCSVTAFKKAALEYVCLNLETILENRLLDDLDDELFRELDEVCRANQLNCQPISRGRNSEDYVAERYPEIVPFVGQDRQRRIDSMRLRTRRHEDELREGKFRQGSVEKGIPSLPLARKAIAPEPAYRGAEPNVEENTVLKSKQSTGDLIFQMDDENLPSDDQPEGKSPSRIGISQQLQGKFDHGDSRRHPLHAVEKANDPGLETYAPSPTQIGASTPMAKSQVRASIGAPWSSVGPSGSKAGLKDIMAEALGSYSSGTGLNKSSRWDVPASKLTASKLSQRERKKLQYQQAQELFAEQEASRSTPASPWQTVNIKSNSSLKTQTESHCPQNVSVPTRTPSKVPMTLRQTVSGARSPQSSTPTPPKQKQHAQSPEIVPSSLTKASPRPITKKDFVPRSSLGAMSTHTTTLIQPTPRSLTYNITPRNKPDQQQQQQQQRYIYSSPSPSTSQLSLAYILKEQQSEKDELRESVTAKHKLQDIQLEQEFQEWWDQESKRVREEAERAELAAKKDTRTGVGSGKGRWRGCDRNGGGGNRNRSTGRGPESGPGKSKSPGQARSDRERRYGGGSVGNISDALATAASIEKGPSASLTQNTANQDSRRSFPDRGRGGSRWQGHGHGHGPSIGGTRSGLGNGKEKERVGSSS